jgi:hypothetical protein
MKKVLNRLLSRRYNTYCKQIEKTNRKNRQNKNRKSRQGKIFFEAGRSRQLKNWYCKKQAENILKQTTAGSLKKWYCKKLAGNF